MGIDFLTASAGAARRLQAAQARHARLKSQADARLASAQARHRAEADAAADVEAQAWVSLLAIPGMSVASASQITRTSPAVVRRWIAIAAQTSSSRMASSSHAESTTAGTDAVRGASCT